MKLLRNNNTSISQIQTKSETSFFDHHSEQEQPFFAGQEAVKSEIFFSPSHAPNKGNIIQPKLTVGQPNDVYEQEADNVADKVVQRLAKSSTADDPSVPNAYSDISIQRKCAACNAEEENVQRKPSNTEGVASSNIESQLNSSKGNGSPLPEETRTSMESAMGADFTNVRVHTGSNAVQMSQDLNAQAFTHGSDVYFNEGKYNPSGSEGERLLAHELVHTVQQRGEKNIQKATNIPQINGSCQKSGGPESQYANTHPGNVFEVGTAAGSKNEEISLWNFCVGESTLRKEHVDKLYTLSKEWKKTIQENAAVSIRISGAASSSGNTDSNSVLALKRAKAVNSLLVLKGIPSAHIIIDNEANKRRVSQDSTPEGLAKNRRVDVFLVRPSRVSKEQLPFSTIHASNLQIGALKTTPEKLLSRPLVNFTGDNFARSHPSMQASADIMVLSLLGGTSAGFYQVLKSDTRQARYVNKKTGEKILLDYNNCGSFPCKDTEAATSNFSIDSGSLILNESGDQSKKITISDWPGTVFPKRFPNPKNGAFEIEAYNWNMDFIIILVLRESGFFTPIHSVNWTLNASENIDLKNKKLSGNAPAVTFGSWTEGMVAPINLEKIFSSPSCRFFMRGMNNFCDPTETKI